MKDPVLVLDANQRSALAAIRSLGRRGVRVVSADDTPRTVGGASRYCTDSFCYPSPCQDPRGFIRALSDELAKRDCALVLPMSDVTTYLLARFRDEIPPVRLPLGGLESLEILADKWKLYTLAEELRIPVPRTQLMEPDHLLGGSGVDMAYPFVLKPVRSRTFDGSRWVKGSVHCIASASDIPRAFASDPSLARIPYLVQEYVPGWGQGIFGLFDRGRPVTFFAHRRIREKPPTGGVSVLSESIPLDATLLGITRTLMGAVPWHGVAMAEFRMTPSGRPYLLEVNPRFWGSLQLAIDAGIDFPWLLYNVCLGNQTPLPSEYDTHRRCRWLLGDLDNLYITLKSPSPLSRKLRALLRFLLPSGRRTRHEVNRCHDLKPFLVELYTYCLGPHR